jgi:hypothetical protein
LEERGMAKAAWREQQRQYWLERLREWSRSGEALKPYMSARGVPLWQAHRWLRILQGEGLWPQNTDAPLPKAATRRPQATVQPVRFARVELTDSAVQKPSGLGSLVARVILKNGRRVELDLDEGQLARVLGILEATP